MSPALARGLAEMGGVDIVLGTSNSNDAMDSIQGLRPDGKFVLMGFDAKPLALSAGDLIMKRIRVIGSQQNHREHLYEALAHAASGKVKTITETYKLDDINRAYEPVVEGKVRFRAVIQI
jgi:D-arabinose 1-dehydrogenase-like Zn-dependent alcohol dehydrogenase